MFMSEITLNAIKELVKRECYWLKQKIASFRGGKYVLFPAGPTAQHFFYTLKDEFGIEAEFFIDNNPAMEGKIFCGKPVKNFQSVFNGGGEYNIFIPTMSKYYQQIMVQLDTAGISSYIYANAFIASQLWDRYEKVANMLEDELSKLSYWGAIYCLMTGNNTFISSDPMPEYFGVHEFSLGIGDTIVDAGAYVGDTVEEYIKRSCCMIKIYAFEPYHAVLDNLKKRVSRLYMEYPLSDGQIEIIPAGVGSETKSCSYSFINQSMLQTDEHGGLTLPLYSLDDFFNDKPPFTILKADIEGGEMDMLKGAREMIKRHKPKMTICIYHSPQDFAQIAEYIRSLVPEYRLFVRSHLGDHQGTILYCVV
jgi:FkbM family methyltransferase